MSKRILIVSGFHAVGMAFASHVAEIMSRDNVDVELLEVAPTAIEMRPVDFERRFMEPVQRVKDWKREQARPPRPKDLYKKGRRR